jgi:tetratricopeptide (TPR) repeat protein
LTRACELNPNEPEYAYQRGMAYRENNQPIPAMADFDHALELNPDYVQARVVRAQLRLASKDNAGANVDLDAADRMAPKQADIRFTMGELYGKADVLGAAVTQYDLWIISHPDDSKMMAALYRRCSLRALQGQDLDKGLSDCNGALRLSSKSDQASANILRVRGLVRLRLGDYDKSIADFDDSLKSAPKNPEALYGRGVAEMRKHKTPEGQADLAEASKLRPNIAAEFSRRGISP